MRGFIALILLFITYAGTAQSSPGFGHLSSGASPAASDPVKPSLNTAPPSFRKTVEELILSNPPFKECHASTIVEASPGVFLAAFFGGSNEGNKDVCIWMTVSTKGRWGKPYIMADGVSTTGDKTDGTRLPCWNPVLFKTRDGRLFLFYKVGPNPRQWWGMVRTSADLGKTWSDPARLPDGILGPIKNKPIELSDGTILAPSSVETGDSWTIHLERSKDQGLSWERIPIDQGAGYKVIQPTILTYPGDSLQLLCRSDRDHIVTAWSTGNGGTWGPLSMIDLPNPNSGIDAVTLRNGWQLLVYNPTKKGREWSNGRARLNVAISGDGRHWTDIAVLENGQKEEYSYPAVIQAGDGSIHITYTYDRKNIKHVVLIPATTTTTATASAATAASSAAAAASAATARAAAIPTAAPAIPAVVIAAISCRRIGIEDAGQ
jgi:alpha-L-fucosidase